jgi:hypothetical protein
MRFRYPQTVKERNQHFIQQQGAHLGGKGRTRDIFKEARRLSLILTEKLLVCCPI